MQDNHIQTQHGHTEKTTLKRLFLLQDGTTYKLMPEPDAQQTHTVSF